MLVRYRLQVHGTQVVGLGPVSFAVDGPSLIDLVVTRSEEHESTLLIQADVEVDPDEAVLSVFEDVAAGRLPRDADPIVNLDGRVEPGKSLEGLTPPLSVMPEPFRSFVDSMRTDLASAASQLADLYRWIGDDYAAGRRWRSVKSALFSPDGEQWYALPADVGISLDILGPSRLDDYAPALTVQSRLDAGDEEPIGFTLLAEALHLRDVTPRGSLVMAMTALEVGFKAFIGELVPEAEWLAMRSPTPPLDQMLRDYLPQLPVRAKLPSGETLPPPKKTMKVIVDAINRRNKVAHRGEVVKASFLGEVILAVGDVLRLLDYYLGQEWAAEHMSSEFATQLGLRD